jgi:molybdopterin converting factor small subunit
MHIHVRFTEPFISAVGRAEVEVIVPDGVTVRHLVVHLCDQYPDLGQHVLEEDGGVTEYLTMFVNDRPVTDFNMQLNHNDSVLMLFPISGG